MPTFNVPLIPTPPVTTKAPVVLLVEAVEEDTTVLPENVLAPAIVCA